MTDTWPHVAPAPGTPSCGPPSFEPERGWWVTRHADVRAALTDPAFQVPAVDTGAVGTAVAVVAAAYHPGVDLALTARADGAAPPR
ncbi:hypothetical protein ACIBEF_17245 [Micromonospora sp. NPDC050795]|uniref:hypothetical protein n=1 Tax=Micromonospora sp. NPDC050795 TaxID=3364282 RepID=UPI003793BF49